MVLGCFEDAYDWVVEPNVLGMGTYAVGDLMVTKPYVSGSAYVNKMSDYRKGCAFDPKTTCPMTALYWDFLGRNASVLRPTRGCGSSSALRKRDPARRERDRTVAEAVTAQLAEGGIRPPRACGCRRGRRMTTLVWFKRDLRVTDHAPLLSASDGPCICLYIYEPSRLRRRTTIRATWRT